MMTTLNHDVARGAWVQLRKPSSIQAEFGRKYLAVFACVSLVELKA